MMLLSYAPTSLAGTLGGSAAVEKLQGALKALSQATAEGAYDPGVIDGVAGPKTISAVAIVLPKLGGLLNSSVASVLQVGLTTLMITDPSKARSLVEQYATQLTVAILALIARSAGQGGSAVQTPATVDRFVAVGPMKVLPIQNLTVPLQPAPPAVPDTMAPVMLQPWYTTWWGLASIGLAGVGTVVLISLLAKK